MFCTTCAAANPIASSRCSVCGAGITRSRLPTISSRAIWPWRRELLPGATRPSHPRRRQSVLRALYTAPLLVLIIAVAALYIQQRGDQAEVDRWYTRAAAAAEAGRFVEAVDGFTAASGYLDADVRREAAAAALAPYRVAYDDGLAALDAGDYDAATASLLPVARDLPDYDDVTRLLAEARRLRAGELERQVAAAEGREDWLGAEQALMALSVADPGDGATRARLSELQQQHAPIVLGRDHALYLVSPDGTSEQLLTDAVPALWPVWSPDRTRVAFASVDPEATPSVFSLYVINADGTDLTLLATQISGHAPPLWSPDGTHIAYTSFAGYDPLRDEGAIGVAYVEVATGREHDVSGSDRLLAFNPSWSPTGDRLAFIDKTRGPGERAANAPGDVLILDLATEEITNLTEGRAPEGWSVHWSPVEDRFLIFSLRGQSWYESPETSIGLIDGLTGAVERVTPELEPVNAPVWSPDGQSYAYVQGDTVLRVRSDSRSDTWITADDDLSGALTYSPDGGALIAVVRDSRKPSLRASLADDAAPPLPVRFDFDADDGPFRSPPQWAPVSAEPREGSPSIGGTSFDNAMRHAAND